MADIVTHTNHGREEERIREVYASRAKGPCYTTGMCPEAEKACREVVNLPTHLKVDAKTAERTLAFLKEVGEPV